MAYIHLDGGLELYTTRVDFKNESIRRDIVFQWRGGRSFWRLFEVLPKAVHVGRFPYVCLRDQYQNYIYVLIVDDPRARVARFRVRFSSQYLIKCGLSEIKDFEQLRKELLRFFEPFGVYTADNIEVSRLDLAIDDLFFKVDEAIQAHIDGLIRSKFSTVSTILSDQGNSITFGRGSGAWQVCIYNKTKQEQDLAKLAHIYEKLENQLPSAVLDAFTSLPTITRLEFRFKRELLTSLSMGSLDRVDLGALLSFGRDKFKILETKCTNQRYEILNSNYARLFFSQEPVKYKRSYKKPSGIISRKALKCACTIISKHLAKSVSLPLSWSLVLDQIASKVPSLCGSSSTPTDTPQRRALSCLSRQWMEIGRLLINCSPSDMLPGCLPTQD